jgi:hypothetical protein
MMGDECQRERGERRRNHGHQKIEIFRLDPVDRVEGWSQDTSEDIAQELRRRCDLQLRDVPSGIQDFVERHEGHDRQPTMRLV